MPTLEEIKNRFAQDQFAAAAGVEIKEAQPGRAVCVLPLYPKLLNANGVPMGGALFTLADFTYAVASNAYSETVFVSQHISMTFLAPAKGKVLTAEAVCLKEGKKTCLYQVNIRDDSDVYVAHMTVNGFAL